MSVLPEVSMVFIPNPEALSRELARAKWIAKYGPALDFGTGPFCSAMTWQQRLPRWVHRLWFLLFHAQPLWKLYLGRLRVRTLHRLQPRKFHGHYPTLSGWYVGYHNEPPVSRELIEISKRACAAGGAHHRGYRTRNFDRRSWDHPKLFDVSALGR